MHLNDIIPNLDLLSKRNKKLGQGIATFSISCGTYCPGKTESCKACYGHAMETEGLAAGSIAKGWAIRGKRTETMEGLASLEADLVREYCKLDDGAVSRPHVGGDFHSVPYIQMWARIAQAFPKLQFFAYTRSWRVPELREALEGLRALPNFVLFASMDKHSGLPPAGWRYAMMGSLHGFAAPGTVLCPELMGKVETCGDCGLCFNPKARVGVTFPIHGRGTKKQARRDYR